MRYGDLSHFTHDELSNFTYAQLMLGKLELLEEAQSSPDIPKEIVDKIYNLSYEVLAEHNDTPFLLPKNKKLLTLGNIIKLMKFCITVKEFNEITMSIIESLLRYLSE